MIFTVGQNIREDPNAEVVLLKYSFLNFLYKLRLMYSEPTLSSTMSFSPGGEMAETFYEITLWPPI